MTGCVFIHRHNREYFPDIEFDRVSFVARFPGDVLGGSQYIDELLDHTTSDALVCVIWMTEETDLDCVTVT